VKLTFALLIISLLASVATARAAEVIRWKAVLVAGDDSIDAFDNARDELGRKLALSGIAPRDLIDLSFSQTDPGGSIWPASIDNLRLALLDLHPSRGEGCLLHLTSHGNEDGFFLGDDPAITPELLSALLDESCGSVPTVVLVSACYSGIFTAPVMRRPNRVILTAARDDRSSFGCDAESDYTFWDDCLLRSYESGVSWREIYRRIDECISAKEKQQREPRSFPQGFFGSGVADLRAPSFHWRLPASPAFLFDWLWGQDNACYLPSPESPSDGSDLSCL